MSEVKIKGVRVQAIEVPVESISPMIQHRFPEKAKREMLDKMTGKKKTKNRDPRDPEQEFRSALYLTSGEEYGIPAVALKAAIVSAAHNDLGLPRTHVQKALFIPCSDANGVLPIEVDDDPVMREDHVRVGRGSTDLRYRPEFRKWRMTVPIEFDADVISAEDVVNLVERAGFGVGIGDWRPEKGGEHGRFRVERDAVEAVDEVAA